MSKLKLILFNPETEEILATTPTVMSANIEASLRQWKIYLTVDFNEMKQEQFNKLTKMILN